VINVASYDPGTPAATSCDVVGTYVGKKNTASTDYMQAIRKWLLQCDGHACCSQNMSETKTLKSSEAPLPKRCIRVELDDKGKTVIHLEETDGRVGAYISVSHRWIEPMTSLSSTYLANYPERKLGRGFDNLPKLFNDVFYLAIQLGIPFVWIDSLCIIQDSIEDWKAESIKMGTYYLQARLTVATSIPDQTATEGLFNTSFNQDVVPRLVRLPYRGKTGQRGHFYVYPFDYGLKRNYRQQISQSELLTRSWVFQEWLMSRRIVCYTPSGIFMQCQRDLPKSELGEPVDYLDEFTTDASAELSLKASWSFGNANANGLRFGWERIVEAYSRTKFTKPENDRMVALSGIAQEFSISFSKLPTSSTSLSQNRFLAGLWLWCLHQGLLWQQAARGPHQRLGCFPTWSWASIYAQVMWRRGLEATSRHRLECNVQKALIMSPSRLYTLGTEAMDGPEAARTAPGNITAEVGRGAESGPSLSDQAAMTTNDFAVLQVRGKLQPVLIRSYFEKSDAEIVRRVVGQRRSVGQDCWRTVVLPGSKTMISGWVSVEDPALQSEDAFRTGPVIYTLLVSTESGKGESALAFGNILPWHSVCNVLLLKRVGQFFDGFQRIGVGQLFGPEPEKGFEMATERAIWLL